MKVVRIYTGEDGQSRLENLELPLERGAIGWGSELVPVTGARLFETPEAIFTDSHPSTKRQLVAVLNGVMELVCPDGSSLRIETGDLALFDDTTGPGHTTRWHGPGRCLMMPTGDDFDLARYQQAANGT